MKQDWEEKRRSFLRRFNIGLERASPLIKAYKKELGMRIFLIGLLMLTSLHWLNNDGELERLTAKYGADSYEVQVLLKGY